MPVTCSTANEIFIGAGDVYCDGLAVGATMENNLFRVVREYFTPDLNGVPGPIIGLDYIQSETAELEVSIPELSASNLALSVPGARNVPYDSSGVLAATTPFNDSLAADSVAGATNIKTVGITNATANDLVQIGKVGEREVRKVTAVGTAGAGGTGITLATPLSRAHKAAELVQEIENTTLAAASAIGDTNIKVTALMGIQVNDYVVVEAETRQVTTVGTVGAGGTGLTFLVPLSVAHANGAALYRMTTQGGGQRIESDTWYTRRVPSAAYHAWELRVPGLGAREVRFGMRSAIMTENPEFEAADDGTLAPRLTLQARWDPCAPGTSPWYIDRVG